MLNEPLDRLPAVLDRGWNGLANSGPLAATLVWWAVVTLLGLGAWPLCLRACRGLPDRGYLLAKAIGWLVAGYVLWLGASNHLLANRVADAYGVLGVLVLVGAWVGYRARRRLAALWAERRRLLLGEELLFSASYLAFVFLRYLNPDLWQPWFGGEKMMEFAYLNAITKSAHFPPYDPYFAGGYINYYYYGLYLVNLLIKLSGVVPPVAFNLAVPTCFALTVAQAFSFGHALTAELRGRRWLWGGLAAALGVAVLGNLTVLVQWLGSLVALGGGNPQPTSGLEALAAIPAGLGRWLSGQGALLRFDYWYQATRIIPFTINEFPFFSFLFADLHPHMMAMPFALAALVLLAGRFFARAKGAPPPAEQGQDRPRHRLALLACLARGLSDALASPGPLLLLALVIGALGPLNTWDLPTYLGLAAVVLVWRAAEQGSGWQGVFEALAVAALAYVLYLPFYTHYAAPSAVLEFWPNRTGLRYFLVVWGLWLAALYGWLLPRWWGGSDGAGRLRIVLAGGPKGCRTRALLHALAPATLARARRRAWGMAVALVLSVVALAAGEGVVALLLPLIALAGDLWLRPTARRAERLAALVAVVGLAILAVTELVFLADFLRGSEWQRMNTVFKFGIQAWVLLAVAAAAGLPTALAWLRGRLGWGRRLAWAAPMVVLLVISVAYAPLAVVARVGERTPGGPPPVGTLDGLAYMRTGVYNWPNSEHPIVLRYDYEAILWLLDHVHGTPIIAEAPLGYYREGGMRVSSYTGLPTLLGAHQVEQRPAEAVAERGEQAQRLYEAQDLDETVALLQELHVRYVYFGQLEEYVYGPASRAKFEALVARGDLQVAYRNPKVTIYRSE